tara:strand:+ start:1842 stop:2501 length:660 start_codon:yes stop_codon:yes gene_type:complete
MKFFSSVFGSRTIKKLMENNEPFLPPHLLRTFPLSREQANENLRWFLEVKDQRLANFADNLRNFGFSEIENLSENYAEAELQLDSWFKNTLSKYRKLRKIAAPQWEARELDNPQPAIGFLTDVAILCGELIIARQPLLQWDVDYDAFSVRKKASTLGSIVLFTPRELNPTGVSLALDVRSIVIFAMWEVARNRNAPVFLRRNYFSLISDTIEGRYHQKF